MTVVDRLKVCLKYTNSFFSKQQMTVVDRALASQMHHKIKQIYHYDHTKLWKASQNNKIDTF